MKSSTLFRIWGLVSLPAFLVSGYLTGKSASCLKSNEVPGGIIAFEVAWTDREAENILADWAARPCLQGTGIHAALRSIKMDYYFIPAWCLFLSIPLLLLTSGHSAKRGWLVIVWVAGLLDLTENLFMSQALLTYPAYSVSAWTYSLPSTFKWVGVVAVITKLLFSLHKEFFTGVKNTP